MKNLLFAMMGFGLFSMQADAQTLPKPSPDAVITQTIGLTEVTVRYSRPCKKGRVIFGDLVPYEKIWRTGANKCTRIQFSNDVMFMEKPVPAGEYSLFTIPSEQEWTIILNKETELWGTSKYDSLQDVLRVKMPPMPTPEEVECFTFSFDHLMEEVGILSFKWDHLNFPIMIKTNDHALAMANIEKAISELKEGEYRAYQNGANYLNNKGMHDEAMSYIEKAISIADYWYSYWVKAKIQAAKGSHEDALVTAQVSLDKGEQYYTEEKRPFNFKETMMKDIEKWRAQVRK